MTVIFGYNEKSRRTQVTLPDTLGDAVHQIQEIATRKSQGKKPDTYVSRSTDSAVVSVYPTKDLKPLAVLQINFSRRRSEVLGVYAELNPDEENACAAVVGAFREMKLGTLSLGVDEYELDG